MVIILPLRSRQASGTSVRTATRLPLNAGASVRMVIILPWKNSQASSASARAVIILSLNIRQIS